MCKGMLRNLFLIGTLLLVCPGLCAAREGSKALDIPAVPFKVAAAPERGFAYPYYLYVPPELRAPAARGQRQTILVVPNNTGVLDDSLEVHEADVRRLLGNGPEVASVLRVMVLMPVFPRPKTDWRIYTQALDRDALTTDRKEYRRFDLQLVAMIDDARARMRKLGLKFDRKVLLNGFSAAGMFVNRFTFLHPTRVKAAAVGSPGGWPIAPADEYKGKALPYPIGTADFKALTGRKLDLKSLRKVPLFVFMGDVDENDSVVFRDSYEEADEKLIFELFGQKPVERWPSVAALYQAGGLNATFKLYPGIAHTVTPEMRDEVRAFLAKYK